MNYILTDELGLAEVKGKSIPDRENSTAKGNQHKYEGEWARMCRRNQQRTHHKDKEVTLGLDGAGRAGAGAASEMTNQKAQQTKTTKPPKGSPLLYHPGLASSEMGLPGLPKPSLTTQ